MATLLLFATRTFNALVDHWRIGAMVALLLAYGWHRHVVDERDDALRDLASAAHSLEQATQIDRDNVAELHRLTDSLAELHARIAAAETGQAAAAQRLDGKAQTVTREILRNADPAFCPVAPGLRAALDGLRSDDARTTDRAAR